LIVDDFSIQYIYIKKNTKNEYKQHIFIDYTINYHMKPL
jgi:hypothetical protein